MMQKLKDLLKYLNEQGAYLPMFRDHGKPSVSVTLLVISSVLVIAGICSIDNVNFYQALAWHVTSAVLYYNRGAKISKEGIEIEASKKETNDN